MSIERMRKADIAAAVEAGAVLDLSVVFTRDYSQSVAADDMVADAAVLHNADDRVSLQRAKHAYGAFYVSDMVGKGKTWETAAAYGDAVGVNGSMVTRYKRMGRLFYVHGVNPDASDDQRRLWTGLTQYVNRDAVLREAVDKDQPASHEWLAEQVRILAANDGKRPDVTVTPDGETVVEGEVADVSDETPTPTMPNGSMPSVRDLFAALTDAVGMLSDKGDETALRDIATRAATLAATATDAAATVAAKVDSETA